MINFLITNKNYYGNLTNQIKLNNNFSIFFNKIPDTLIRGKIKYFFFGKINGYSNKGNFFNIKNFNLKKSIHLFLNRKNIFDGNYLFLKVHNDRIDFNIDNKGLYDVFYSDNKGKIFFSNNFTIIKDELKINLTLDNFSILTAINSISKRPPSKRTFFNEIKRIDFDSTNIIKKNNFFSKENKFEPLKTKEPINEKEFLKQYQNELSSFSNIGSNNLKVLFMSSGWDSLMILKLLVERFGMKRVKPIIARLKFSKSTKNFNQFELDKAKKICDHFKIKLNYVDIDYEKIQSYINETKTLSSEKMLTGTFAFYLHYKLIKHGIKKFGSADFFSGEISDGAHNFGFSQYLTLVDNQSNGYREYCDKMINYLFGPTFFNNVISNKHLNDPIYNFLGQKFKIKPKKISYDKRSVFENFMQSMFVISNRFPLNSEISEFLNNKKKKEYLNMFNKEYLKNINFKNNSQIYSCYLYLYNKFHWQGSTVRPAYYIANNFDSNFINIFWNSSTQKTLSTMPESFGRGLELRSTKYPEKEILKKYIEVDKLNVGPHSYLSDTSDADPYHEVLYNSKYRKIIAHIFEKFDPLKHFDKNYFNLSFIKKVIKSFKTKNHNVSAESIYSLFCICQYLYEINYKNEK